jgi:hypothetical protein
MLYSALAGAVLVCHGCFIVFVTLGGLAVLRWQRLAWLHLPAVAWGVFVEFSGRICPLTPLENEFRMRGGDAGYTGGFIDHYLTSWIYPEGLTRNAQFVIGSLFLLLNVTVYVLVWRKVRRNR